MMNGCPRWSILTVPLLAALGCSDPVPRPPQGNLKLSVQTPTTGSATCPVPGKTYIIGNPNAPDANQPGDRLIDGEHSATIKCSVKGSGPYTFSGTVQAVSSEHAKVTLTITNGMINADKLTGTATVGLFTTDLAGTFNSPEGGCAVKVISGNVKPGSLWAQFSCPSITETSTGKACSIGPDPIGSSITTVVFENCDGS